MGVQGLVGTMRQTWVHGPGLIGTVEHFIQALIHHQRQVLPTVSRVCAQRWPAPSHILLKGSLKSIRGLHFMGVTVQRATLLIPNLIERKNDL